MIISTVILLISIQISSSLSANDCSNSNTGYIIDLDQPIDLIESLIKRNYRREERAIVAAAVAQVNAKPRSVRQPHTPTDTPTRISRILSKAYCHGVYFTSATKHVAPLCGLEIKRKACTLLKAHNDGRLMLMPFDLDELVRNNTDGITPFHRNSPLVSMARLCKGLKASNKDGGAETCIGSYILEKLENLTKTYRKPQIRNSDQPSLVDNSRRYLTVKAILKNVGYANTKPTMDHGTGNAIDIMCGNSTGIGSGADNCSTIKSLCVKEGASTPVDGAELNGCGEKSSPLTSIHCSFFPHRVIDLGNMELEETEDLVREHNEVYNKKINYAIAESVAQTVVSVQPVMDTEHFSVDETIDKIHGRISEKVSDIISDSYDNRMIFNTSTMPQRRYPIQFKSVAFSMRNGREQMDRLLNRNRRQAMSVSECSPASARKAQELLEMYNNGKVVFLPHVFLEHNLTKIDNVIKRTLNGQSSSTESPSTREAVNNFIRRKNILLWQIQGAREMQARRRDTTTTTTTTTTARTTSSTSRTAIVDDGPYETDIPGALESIIRIAYGKEVYTHSYDSQDRNKTCISFEVLNGILIVANDFYDKHLQPIYIAALPATKYHNSTSDSRLHKNGLAVDALCGNYIYPGAAEERFKYCPELLGSCYRSKMYSKADLGSKTGCLAGSIVDVYGIVHCRY